MAAELDAAIARQRENESEVEELRRQVAEVRQLVSLDERIRRLDGTLRFLVAVLADTAVIVTLVAGHLDWFGAAVLLVWTLVVTFCVAPIRWQKRSR